MIKKKENPKNPKRKSGTISAFGLPSKGAEGVRSHHKNNEEKILSHRRFGFTDEEVDIKGLNKMQKLRNSSAFSLKKEHIIIRHWFNVYILIPPCFSR